MNMVTIKTADLIGPALDYAVAKADGFSVSPDNPFHMRREEWGAGRSSLTVELLTVSHDANDALDLYSPSTDWAQCGALIEKFNVEFTFERAGLIFAELCKDDGLYHEPFSGMYGKNYLTAACRAIVAAKLGDEVQVPAELVQP